MKTQNKKILSTTLTVAAFLLNTGVALASSESSGKEGTQTLVAAIADQKTLAQGLEGKCSCDDCK